MSSSGELWRRSRKEPQTILFASSGNIPPDDHGIAFSVWTVCLLAAVMVTAARGASALYGTHSDLALRKDSIRNMGVLSPAIAMYEEQYRFRLLPHEEWSCEATDAFRNSPMSARKPEP
jgi:hypothetical protein